MNQQATHTTSGRQDDPPRQPYIPGRGLPLAALNTPPVAPPPGSSTDLATTHVSGRSVELRGTDTALTSSSQPSPSSDEAGHSMPRLRRPRLRVNADALNSLAAQLPDRDREVLRRISQHHYLTTHQVQGFCFTDHASAEAAARTARHVLQRLARHALVRPLGRRVGGFRAGSAARIWQLAPAGARLLRDDGVTHRTHEPSPRLLAHSLAVADVHLALRGIGEDRQLGAVESVHVQIEPASWRRSTGPGGEARLLRPDLAAAISTAGFTDRWFIEVDLGTESLPALLRKCGQYEEYRATGIEQDQHRIFPLVLWIFADQIRADKLRSAILRSPRLTPQLYRSTTFDAFASFMREALV